MLNTVYHSDIRLKSLLVAITVSCLACIAVWSASNMWVVAAIPAGILESASDDVSTLMHCCSHGKVEPKVNKIIVDNTPGVSEYLTELEHNYECQGEGATL